MYMRLSVVIALVCATTACSGLAQQDRETADTTPTIISATTTSTSAFTTTTRPPPTETTAAEGQEADVIMLPPGERTDEAIIAAAHSDLAERLQLPESEIQLQESGAIEVPSANPCGDSGQDVAPPGVVMGHQVVFRAAGNLHSYIATAALLHYCGPD
jgi:hypothetical protein